MSYSNNLEITTVWYFEKGTFNCCWWGKLAGTSSMENNPNISHESKNRIFIKAIILFLGIWLKTQNIHLKGHFYW